MTHAWGAVMLAQRYRDKEPPFGFAACACRSKYFLISLHALFIRLKQDIHYFKDIARWVYD